MYRFGARETVLRVAVAALPKLGRGEGGRPFNLFLPPLLFLLVAWLWLLANQPTNQPAEERVVVWCAGKHFSSPLPPLSPPRVG